MTLIVAPPPRQLYVEAGKMPTPRYAAGGDLVGKRVSYRKEPIGLRIEIAALRFWPAILFVLAWLGGWTAGGVFLFTHFPGKGDAPGTQWFAALWLLGWAFGEVSAAHFVLVSVFGKEIITASWGSLAVRRDVLGFGRAKDFDTHRMTNLRVENPVRLTPAQTHGSPYLSESLGTVAFEHEGKTHRFGALLEEDEARQVVERLRAYLPESAFAQMA